MEQQRFDISFKGEILPGFELERVKQAVAQLFKADSAQLDKLFSGQICSIKKGVDQATALKYQQALKKAGAKPLITQAGAAAQAQTSATSASSSPAAKPASVATAAPTQAAPSQTSTPQAQTAASKPVETKPAPTSTQVPPATPATLTSAGGLDILPTGSDILSSSERKDFTPANIDTSALSASDDFERLADEQAPPPPAPDVSHLQLGASGEDMSPYARQEEARLNLDVSAINLAEAGSDLQDEYQEFIELPLDLSAISLAETGAKLSTGKQEPEPAAPDVSHIDLQ